MKNTQRKSGKIETLKYLRVQISEPQEPPNKTVAEMSTGVDTKVAGVPKELRL